MGLRSTTHRDDALACMGPVRGPSRLIGACGPRSASGTLSLDGGRYLHLEVWQESWPNFKGLPKVSEVATNHWVFLRYDWSPVSS